MIEFVQGDIFKSGADALVDPVNCVGTMGKGLALEFKKRFPTPSKIYIEACKRGEVRLGTMHVVDGYEKPIIISFPTKQHWRDSSRLQSIVSGLDDLRLVIQEKQIKSVAVPALGCGNGGLRWADVKPEIQSALHGIDARVLVYGGK